MIALKELKIRKFKSFSSTEVVFKGNFIAIVGPNGSGKSNLCEAIMFCLASRPHHLRARSFSELGQADVEARFSDGTVIRRVAEGGKTKLMMNGVKISSSAVPISIKYVPQGETDRFLRMNPKERRRVIEEAAGIAIYEERKREAEQKLSEVESKLSVARAILSEKEEELARFRAEAENAQRFRQIKARLRGLRKGMILAKLRETEALRQKYSEERTALLKDIAALEQELAELEKQTKEELEKMKKRAAAENAQRRIQEIDDELKGIRRDLRRLEQKMAELKQRIQEEEDVDLDSLRERLIRLESLYKMGQDIKIANPEQELKALTAQESALRNRIHQLEEKIHELSVQMGNLRPSEHRVWQILKEAGLPGLIGPVAHLIEFDPSLTRAIEGAAGGRLLWIVVEDIDAAMRAVSFLKQNKLGSATFLPLNKCRMKKADGPGTPLSALVRAEPRLLPVVSEVFGDWFLVDEQTARKYFRQYKMVLEDGTTFESKTISGGFRGRSILSARLKEEIEKLRAEKRSLSAQLESLLARRAEVQRALRIRREAGSLENLAEEIKRLRAAVREAEERKVKAEASKLARQTLEMLGEERERLLQKKERLLSERAALEPLLEYLNIEVKENTNYAGVQRKLKQAQRRLTDIERQIAILDERTGALKESLTEFEEVNAIMVEDFSSEIQRLEQELTGIGEVNFLAERLYEEKRQEVESTAQRVQTLLREKEAILEIIGEAEAKKRQVFMETFNEVKRKFAELFSKIFKGKAELILDKPDDPLNAGIDVRIKEGQRTKHLRELSGGERALVSMLIVFSLHMVVPSHLYILDEVDAALDLKNSQKLAQLIKKLSEDSQFLVVTHSREVAAAADTVLGITKAYGKSKVLYYPQLS